MPNTANLLDLNNPQCAAIGLFAAYWAHLETEANFTISALGELVNKDQTMPHRFGQRIKHWRKLVRTYYSDEETKKKALALIDHINVMHDGRSMILHGRPYGWPDSSSDKIIVETSRHLDEWRGELREFDIDLLYQGTAQLELLLKTLWKFNEAHLPVEPTTLPRRYP